MHLYFKSLITFTNSSRTKFKLYNLLDTPNDIVIQCLTTDHLQLKIYIVRCVQFQRNFPTNIRIPSDDQLGIFSALHLYNIPTTGRTKD